MVVDTMAAFFREGIAFLLANHVYMVAVNMTTNEMVPGPNGDRCGDSRFWEDMMNTWDKKTYGNVLKYIGISYMRRLHMGKSR